VISLSQWPLPYNTQHSKETDINATAGFETAIPASKQQQTSALKREVTGNSFFIFISHFNIGIACRYNVVPN
jgi:hypothetical protein